jgi:hypothetical protein
VLDCNWKEWSSFLDTFIGYSDHDEDKTAISGGQKGLRKGDILVTEKMRQGYFDMQK